MRHINIEERRLRARLHELVLDWPRRGYKFMAQILRAEGWRVNKKRVHRLWREEVMGVIRSSILVPRLKIL